ncbi:MAG: hypothetical protein ACPGVB_09205 [Chitinophagales bacterium]
MNELFRKLIQSKIIQHSYNLRHSLYHRYEIKTPIGKISKNLTREGVFKEMTSESKFMAPSVASSPITQGRSIRLLGFPKYNYVRTFINGNNFSATNYTEEGKHMFHPGKITRSVEQIGDELFIVTIGEGTGNYRALNLLMGRPLFKGIDETLKHHLKEVNR